MRELIKPEHLQFVGKMFGIKEEITSNNENTGINGNS